MNRISERLTLCFAWACAVVLVGSISCIIGYLVFKGAGTLHLSLVFGDIDPVDAILFKRRVFDGLFPAIVGTLFLVLLSVVWAIPVGITSGIFLAEYAGKKTKRTLNLLFDVLAGIPSIVVGLFGFSVALVLHKKFSEDIYPCLLISSVALALLVLPYIVRTTQVSLENLSMQTRLTAMALGATKLQNILYVLIPKSLSGIASGVILAIGRCAEDTAVIMLTGVVATAGVPTSIFSNFEALPFYIYYISAQYSDQQELLTGYGAAIILLLICVLLFLCASMIKKQLSYFSFYRA